MLNKTVFSFTWCMTQFSNLIQFYRVHFEWEQFAVDYCKSLPKAHFDPLSFLHPPNEFVQGREKALQAKLINSKFNLWDQLSLDDSCIPAYYFEFLERYRQTVCSSRFPLLTKITSAVIKSKSSFVAAAVWLKWRVSGRMNLVRMSLASMTASPMRLTDKVLVSDGYELTRHKCASQKVAVPLALFSCSAATFSSIIWIDCVWSGCNLGQLYTVRKFTPAHFPCHCFALVLLVPSGCSCCRYRMLHFV